MDRTTVIHVKHAPAGWEHDPQYVYIGREFNRCGHKLPASPFANPFKISGAHPDTGEPMTREECIELFAERLADCPELVDRIHSELRGKTLVCWCAPQPCHGDVLARIANEGDP